MNFQSEKLVRFNDWNAEKCPDGQYPLDYGLHSGRLRTTINSVPAKFQGGFESGSERFKRIKRTLKYCSFNSFVNKGLGSGKKVLDPQGAFLQKWNKIFVLSCVIAVSLDPLFFYVPVINGDRKCVDLDKKMETTASVLRSFTDIFYIFHIILQFRTGFIAPSSRVFGRGVLVEDTWLIAKKYMSSHFLVDILAVLPLPQVVILIIIPNMGGSEVVNTKNLLKFVVLFQYVPRFLRIYPLYKEVTRTSGILTETAWAGAAFNLFLYMLASHVLGASWYLFSIERETTCWKGHCKMDNGCKLYCDDGQGNNAFLGDFCPIQPADTKLFNFGIFLGALESGIVESTYFPKKFFYCFWWGLRNLSSLGQNLETSTYVWEICFAVFISISGLVLFSFLIGNMQTYLQSTTTRLEEMRVKRRDAEQWAVSEEVCSTAKSRSSPSSSSAPASPPRNIHYLAKCVLKGSVVLQVAHGHLRSPTSNDVVFGKETSIELVIIGEDGIVQSVCEQAVFGTIKDLAVVPWNKKFNAQNSQLMGKDLLVVISDSGKLSFLAFCNEMHRFFPVAQVHLSNPGNSRHQLGRMLAVDSSGCFIAVSAYEDRLGLFSLSMSSGSDIIDKKICYPSESEVDTSASRIAQKNSISGTIWSMCFISTDPRQPSKEHNPILAIILNRRGALLNELLLVGWNIREHAISVLSCFFEAGPLAHCVVEVPRSYGFAFVFRIGDALLMDLRDPHNPSCVYRTSLNFLPPALEEQNFVDESCRVHDVDDEGLFNVAACALLELRDYDPMCIDSDSGNAKEPSKHVCSWSWEPETDKIPKMVFCVDTGEFFMIEIAFGSDGHKVHLSECLYKGPPCKALLWVEGRFLSAFVEMGDGMVLKEENGRLVYTSPIQNIAPILDMSVVDYHDEKRDQMFACCGVAPEGSLRIIRSGISLEKLLRTAPIYQGITGTWTVRMKVSDPYHSFLVLSFVEETRVLRVGLNFTDVTDSVGFRPDVCTLACGLVADGLLVQIHQNAVRLCMPTMVAHSGGIPLSYPVCTSWFPEHVSISLGAVAHNMIIVSTSNPCFLFILGVRSLSVSHYEIYEMQHMRLQSELSCISIPQKHPERRKSSSPISLVSNSSVPALPAGVIIGYTFVIGTHRPSVEVLSFVPKEGLRVLASGSIVLTNTMGTAISGCIPQDVRLVLADQFYVLAGLRNGMLLRFEWPPDSNIPSSVAPIHSPISATFRNTENIRSGIAATSSFGSEMSAFNLSEESKDELPINLQLIATRRIGITPVFLVPLSDLLDADMIALSDRPWLLQTARHSLAYTSISFQPSTHATPVCSVECPKGILFVAENSLNLVEMVHNKRLNVPKFHLGGTPKKVLYHSESRLLIVMRTELNNDTCSSDICCVDPLSGSVLSSFKLELGETGKSMELVRVGHEQVLVVGTSLSSGPAIMPSGEAESTKGRLIVLCIEHMQNSDCGSMTFCSKAGSSSQRTSPFREIVGYATEQLSSSSLCSSPDDASCDGIKLEETETWQLRLAYSTTWPGMVLAICPYLDRYFLASAGNAFYVCGFPNDNPQRVRRFAVGRTRFMIMLLTAHFTRIAVGDCRDGILFYSYHEDARKLEQIYCDPSQRLVADCVLMDVDTAVVSDRKGSIAVLSCSDRLEDNASPECNLTPNCAYHMGEIAVSIRKGSFIYKLPADDTLGDCLASFESSQTTIIASTLLGSIVIFIPISSEEYELLEAVQARLAIHPLTAPLLGNDHNEFRSRENPVGVPKILDGDMLSQFLELTSTQQEAVLSFTLGSFDTIKASSKLPPSSPIPVNQVVQLLERVHYALN